MTLLFLNGKIFVGLKKVKHKIELHAKGNTQPNMANGNGKGEEVQITISLQKFQAQFISLQNKIVLRSLLQNCRGISLLCYRLYWLPHIRIQYMFRISLL